MLAVITFSRCQLEVSLFLSDGLGSDNFQSVEDSCKVCLNDTSSRCTYCVLLTCVLVVVSNMGYNFIPPICTLVSATGKRTAPFLHFMYIPDVPRNIVRPRDSFSTTRTRASDWAKRCLTKLFGCHDAACGADVEYLVDLKTR